LTGGKFFTAGEPALINKIESAISTQEATHKVQVVKPQPVQYPPVSIPAAVHLPVRTKETSVTLTLAIVAIAVLFAISAYSFLHRKKENRTCPSCGRMLRAFQIECPDCIPQTKIVHLPQLKGESTQELDKEKESFRPEWYELKQETQEILSKTTYLNEVPLLVVTKGSNLGESYELSKDRPISIGRSRVNEIRPTDGSISAQHCRIIPENGNHVVYDLGSTNGTLLNNRKVNKATLKEGDMIAIGETVLQYKIDHAR
jgi:FHA domain